MKPIFLAPFIVLAVSVIAGCSPGPKKAKYTVEQYLVDRSLMERTVEECANNPGDLNNEPDCVNAIAAAERASHRTLRDLDQERRPTATKDRPKASSAH
jgi:hypothetical protein